jgi:hypothetical protein
MNAAVQMGQRPDGTEEEAVLLATALAVRSLHENRGVGLAAYGREPMLIPPALGQGQQWRLLRALALVKANGPSDLSLALQDLGQTAKRGSAAVVITPNNEAGWLPNLLHLAQRGISCTVVLLDRASYQKNSASAAGKVAEPQKIENSAGNLREVISRLGFDCYLMGQGEMGDPLELRERHGFWEFKVTPSGRAITVRNPLEGR